jgi:hypothetical protein
MVTPTPDQRLVTWAGRMCDGISQLDSERSKASQTLQFMKDPRLGSMVAQSYPVQQPESLQMVADIFTELKPSGNAAADRLTAQYRTALGKAIAKIEPLAGDPSTALQRDNATAIRVSRQIATLIKDVKPAGPDLPALAKSDAAVNLAYREAPSCKATADQQPFPKARDGKNYQACADGTCEVLISKAATFVVKGKRITVTVVDRQVSISNREADGGGFTTSVGVGGNASWGTSGAMTNATAVGIKSTSAVLRLSAK